MPLSNKQQAFVGEYCINGLNASEAYRKAYPQAKSGWNAHGARLIAKDSITKAISKINAAKQAKVEYNYEIAIKELNQVKVNLTKQAKTGNIPANAALTQVIREKNAITGLHKQIIVDETQTKELTEQEQLEARRLASIRLRKA
jgi:hypothetical protein